MRFATGLLLAAVLLAADPRLDATTIQTVGSKGHDGFTLALVADRPGQHP